MFNNTLQLVVAYTFNKQGIGKSDSIPWDIPEDIKHFKRITTSSDEPYNFSIVIMGRITWNSINDKNKPLKNRFNIILSNDSNYIIEQTEKYKNYCYNNNNNNINNINNINNNNINNTNNKNNIKTGIKFTTWDDFFSTGYLDVEKYLYQRTYNKYGIEYIDKCVNKTRENALNHFNYYIIGGEQIYIKAIESNFNLIIHATEIYNTSSNSLVCDTFFPKIENVENTIIINNVSEFYKSIKLVNVCGAGLDNINNNHLTNFPIWYRFITYSIIKNHNKECLETQQHEQSQVFISQETAYLTLMRTILETGQTNNDRTGVGTLSVFGAMLKYNLQDTFPISTTKRIFFRAIFEELMLYLSGNTDNTILQKKDIHVWDGNTSRDFLDKRGLSHYVVGDMGHTYGFNMRHYGAQYLGCKATYPHNYGYDQLENVITLIKNEPTSRRIIIDLWDPSTVDSATLPSCLCKYQFSVNVEKKELNLIIYLRSSDYFLANNWNTCTGALFVHLLCNLEGIHLTPGVLTVFIADAHIYKTHIEQVKQNLTRNPYPYPKLLICGGKSNLKKKNILEFTYEDLEFLGYKSHPNIKADMAI